MYTEFYGLREKPFSLTPDPRYLYLSESHREALAHLLFGVEQGEGFIVITGEVGTGKTTLCRTLLQRLTPDTEVALIFNPRLSAFELLQAIAAEFGLPAEDRTRRELAEQLNRFLLQKKAQGRRVILVVDEGQNLEQETLEEIRLLSNLETETSKLIQIVLFGQPELDAMLGSPALRQLRQRVSVHWRLVPLTAAETREYVRHRLRIAAGAERDLFTDVALREIHRRSRGIPRLVNLLCDRSLLAGYGARATSIGIGLVHQANHDLGGTGAPAPESRVAAPRPRAVAMAAAAVAVLVLAGLAVWRLAPGARDPEAPLADVAAAPPVGEPGLPAAAPEPAAALAPPAPAPAAPRDAPAGPGPLADLEPLLAVSSPGVTTARAMNAVLEFWGLARQPGSYLAFPEALGTFVSEGLGVVPMPETDLEQLRLLNQPALVRLQAPDGAPRSAVLVRVNDASLDLLGLTEDGRPLAVAREAFERVWPREAFLVWRDFEGLPEVLGPDASGPAVEWVQQALERLGFFDGVVSGRFDGATADAVRRFQETLGLAVDGTVGPLTKIALYERLGDYAVPRLMDRREVG